jgi:hypothetical protein
MKSFVNANIFLIKLSGQSTLKWEFAPPPSPPLPRVGFYGIWKKKSSIAETAEKMVQTSRLSPYRPYPILVKILSLFLYT